MDNSKADFYYNTYNQTGGDFPVFRGSRYIQYGSGFGDILRGILRHVLPIVSKGATAFLSGLLQSKNEGGDWAGAAKSAIAPAAKAALNQAATQLTQSGGGKRKRKHKSGKKKGRKHKKKKVYKASKKKAKRQKFSASIPQFNF